jgi:uncharacterized membrane protein HdeD (DUF308 family)
MNLLIIWGLLLLILGIVALVVPAVFTYSSLIFFGAVMFAAGLMWVFFNLNSKHTAAGGWFKPFILLLIGLLFMLFPDQTLVILSVFLLIYLLTDAFASFWLAVELKAKLKSWFLMLLNGFADLVLAAILIWALPHPKLLAQLFGIIIGVSLVIDGVLLLWYGWRLKIYIEKYGKLVASENQE